MKKAAQVLMFFSVLSALKIPWFALQVVAWVGMFTDIQERAGSWSQAVQMTLDPDNRCQLCISLQSVEPGDADNHDQALLTEGESPLLLPSYCTLAIHKANRGSAFAAMAQTQAHWLHAPPLPPPRPPAFS